MPPLSSKQNIHTLVKEIFKLFFDLILGVCYELWRPFGMPTSDFTFTQLEEKIDDEGKKYGISSGS